LITLLRFIYTSPVQKFLIKINVIWYLHKQQNSSAVNGRRK
jgi:hypothetical protein